MIVGSKGFMSDEYITTCVLREKLLAWLDCSAWRDGNQDEGIATKRSMRPMRVYKFWISLCWVTRLVHSMSSAKVFCHVCSCVDAKPLNETLLCAGGSWLGKRRH